MTKEAHPFQHSRCSNINSSTAQIMTFHDKWRAIFHEICREIVPAHFWLRMTGGPLGLAYSLFQS
jgi:hypothetical protein